MAASLDIPAIRKTLKLTQAELAKRAGVDVSTVWRWENGGVPERGPARAFLERLADDASKIGPLRAVSAGEGQGEALPPNAKATAAA